MRAVREDQEITQKQLAERLREAGWSIDPTALTRIENGTRSVRVAQLQLLATALAVSVDELLRDDIRALEDLRDVVHRSLMRARLDLIEGLKAVDDVVNHASAFGGSDALKQTGIPDPLEPEDYPAWVRDRVARHVASGRTKRVKLMPKPEFRGATPEQLAAIAQALIEDLTESYGWDHEAGTDWGNGLHGDLVEPEIERPEFLGFVG